MPTPLEKYQADQLLHAFYSDKAQQNALACLNELYLELDARSQQPDGRWFSWLRRKPLSIKGVYLWGGVGRGKTYLMDVFFDCLPKATKLRTHFHRFMRHVHQRLAHYQGARNPLLKVADDLATQAQVICFDEFFVSDITDAMLLAGLLEALFDRGVVLVATANMAPQHLYENGLQRQRFLPAIDLLQKYTTVVHVDGSVDYRLRNLEQVGLYHFPLNDQADISLQANFTSLSSLSKDIRYKGVLKINNREFHYRQLANNVVWFDFVELCDGPRSQNDYLELAGEFYALVISGVPQMSRTRADQARRFINLVDVCYEANVKLIISAAVALSELYCESSLDVAFQRARSRLFEMQSHEYLAQAHLIH